MNKIIYITQSIILYPLFLMYYLFVHKSVKICICKDFMRWCEWKGLGYNIFNFIILFVEFKEFRSIVYKRLSYRRILVSWLYKGQDHLTLACNYIGHGLIVQHGYSTVICAESIGVNFHVNQCVNVVWNQDKQCSIGDNVTICAGAIVVGGVRIGNNVTIGAGAVVVKDIPDHSVVVGNPMRIIRK